MCHLTLANNSKFHLKKVQCNVITLGTTCLPTYLPACLHAYYTDIGVRQLLNQVVTISSKHFDRHGPLSS